MTAQIKIQADLERRFGEAFDGFEALATGSNLEALSVIAGHRSIRAYSDQPVAPETLRLLAALALSAPAKSDLQQADIVKVADPEIRAAIAELIPSMPWVKEAPAFFVICANGARLPAFSVLEGESFANDHLDAFFNATVDAALVLAFAMLAAQGLGLGCCPISVIRNHCEAVNRLLKLPARVVPLAGLTLGYPKDDKAVVPAPAAQPYAPRQQL